MADIIPMGDALDLNALKGEEYYNYQQKARFKSTIKLSKFPKDYWDRIFKAITPFENKNKKDIFNFNKTEIRNMYVIMNYMSFESLIVDNYNLAKYTVWAIQNSLVDDGINHFTDFTTEELVRCVNLRQIRQSIITRQNILDAQRQIDNAQDRFILMGLFEGIRGKDFSDICLLKMSDIHDNTVHLQSGRAFEISDQLKFLAEQANGETTYQNADGKQLQLVGDYILKIPYISHTKTGALHKNGRNIYNSILRTIGKVGWSDQISVNSIYISGTIDLIKRLAKQSGMSCKDVIYNDALFDEICKQYDFSRDTRRRFILKYEPYLS